MADDHEFHAVGASFHRALLRHDLVDVPLDTFWGVGVPLAGAKGRGGAVVVELRSGLNGVARDYRRGGALGGLLSRSYLDPARPERELRILAALARAGVPVVTPLAALARRHYLVFHRLRLITQWIEDARPLPAFLATHPELRREAVREAGRVTELAMRAGLVHRDLHPDNLIARHRTAPDGRVRVEVFILDLDRAELRPELTTAVRDKMLVRMARYLRRHAAELPVRAGAVDHVRFLAGAGMARAERRSAIARLLPLFERALQRHGLS